MTSRRSRRLLICNTSSMRPGRVRQSARRPATTLAAQPLIPTALLLGCQIAEPDFSFHVKSHNREQRSPDESLQCLICFVERLLRALALGDVGGDATGRIGLSSLIGEGELDRDVCMQPIILR